MPIPREKRIMQVTKQNQSVADLWRFKDCWTLVFEKAWKLISQLSVWKDEQSRNITNQKCIYCSHDKMRLYLKYNHKISWNSINLYCFLFYISGRTDTAPRTTLRMSKTVGYTCHTEKLTKPLQLWSFQTSHLHLSRKKHKQCLFAQKAQNNIQTEWQRLSCCIDRSDIKYSHLIGLSKV